MKSVMILLGVCIVILLLPSILPGINSFRSTSRTEEHGNVTTAVGVTSANITLAEDLFGDRTAEVTALTSSLTGDFPIASSYVAASNKLLVTGLVASGNRTLTATYNIGNLSDYYGADLGARTWPMFIVIGIIGLITAAVYAAIRRE